METQTPASDLERRKKVRIRLRADLAIAPQKYEGRTYYVVKDPVSLRYYRFKEQEHYLLQQMNGETTLDIHDAKFSEGQLRLQYQQFPIAFRNIKIRPLP